MRLIFKLHLCVHMQAAEIGRAYIVLSRCTCAPQRLSERPSGSCDKLADTWRHSGSALVNSVMLDIFVSPS